MILHTLVFKACLYLSLVYALKFGSGQTGKDDIVLLYVLTLYVTFLFMSMWDKRLPWWIRINWEVTGAIWVIYNVNCLIGKRFEESKHATLDHANSYVDFRKLYECFWYEFWPLCSYLIIVLRQFRLKKIVSFLMYITSNAVIALFLLEAVFKFSRMNIDSHILDAFFFTFDINYSTDYPAGYLDPNTLDTSLYNKPSSRTLIFTNDLNVPNRMCSLVGSPFYKKNTKFPFKYTELYRYIGEDVHLECLYSVTDRAVVPEDPVWRVHGITSVFNNSRRRVFHSKNLSVEKKYYDISSMLNIESLKISDFGEYACVATLLNHANAYGTGTTDMVIAVYSLKRIENKIKLLHKAVGHLLTSFSYFYLHSNDDSEEIHLMYLINNQPVNDVCPRIQSHSFPLYLVFGIDLFTILPYIASNELELKYGLLKSARIIFYLCSGGFGIHRVTFIRRIQLQNNKFRIVEVEHPFVFLVLPLSELSIFRFHDDRHLYDKLEKMVENEEDVDLIEHEFVKFSYFIASNEEKVLHLANVIQFVMLIFAAITVYFLSIMFVHIYCRLFIRLPIHYYFKEEMLADINPRIAIEDDTFDVFLSHSDDESELVNGIILPFLEHVCQLRVCAPDRDFHPGVALFSTYCKYIRQSRKIIIILSNGYLEDPNCANAQLEHIILPLVYERKRDVNNVLVILYGQLTEFPDILRWNTRIRFFRWTNDVPDDTKLGIIKNWFFEPKYKPCALL